ncbi:MULTISPECIES: hypothetical protein [Acinetobacter]|jgi:hypothetical protein|uniref:Uncharacterized protein n=2 Tax=Acinetobacter johnsonii TaxID=40214 RepID=D0SGG7_ACIJO|nr:MULTISPECIES: hypothetical protein [Acinetobacter]MDN5625104.1 hypothetical protein [Acinetobacter sp.]EEY94925.1 hypothetical protein HMPREF0016_02940 [Acinetobacter johnsonii SH046]KKD17648.1 hypothetical protein MRSN16897_18070 [Acinetobacter baumannii]KKD26542.1 hypothetical protein MRSN16875_18085 [Acinetobacter baumannii]KRR67614.1 hypothetical protein AQ976_18265 [Acinetobacter baumannii]
MSEFLSEYFEALERLKQGKPIRISASTKITNDSVALEAGRNKGAIKKSRIIFSDLIVAIEIAAKEQKDLSVDQRKIFKLQEEVKNIRKDLENALGRELSLLYENYQLKKQLNTFTELDIIPIRGADSEKL